MSHDRDNARSDGDGDAGEFATGPPSGVRRLEEKIVQESLAAPSPTDGETHTAEFSLGGQVPRTEPTSTPYRTQEVYIRLENTIYGPLDRPALTELLASGELTGYESASTDLRHWTPLLYHPRMNLTGQADPDATHALLHSHSTLPAASRPGTKIDLEALADLPDEPLPPATPLAKIMFKPKKVVRPADVDLPVFGSLENEGMRDMIDRAEIPEDEAPPGSRSIDEEEAVAEEETLRASGQFPSVEDDDASAEFTSGYDDTDPEIETLGESEATADEGADAEASAEGGVAASPAGEEGGSLGLPLTLLVVFVTLLVAGGVVYLLLREGMG